MSGFVSLVGRIAAQEKAPKPAPVVRRYRVICLPKDESGDASLLRADGAVEAMRRGGRQRVRYAQLA